MLNTIAPFLLFWSSKVHNMSPERLTGTDKKNLDRNVTLGKYKAPPDTDREVQSSWETSFGVQREML